MSASQNYPDVFMHRIASANTAFPLMHGPQVLLAGNEAVQALVAREMVWTDWERMRPSPEQLKHLGEAAAAGHRKHSIPIGYTGESPAYVPPPLPGHRIERIGAQNLQYIVTETRSHIIGVADEMSMVLLEGQASVPPHYAARTLLEGGYPRERAALSTLWDVASRPQREHNGAITVLSHNLQRALNRDYANRVEYTNATQLLLASIVFQRVLDSVPLVEDCLERPMPVGLVPLFVDGVTNGALQLEQEHFNLPGNL